jgi:uncharacterized protein GlcG (DUF336 family)
MGSFFKTPKVPTVDTSEADEALAKREASVEAKEKSELRKLAAKKRTMRQGGRLLYSQDRFIPQLGVTGGTMTPTDEAMRNPYETTKRYT